MKPENRGKAKLRRTGSLSNKTRELIEDEKVVLNFLKDNCPMDLNALKTQNGLSNKK